MIPDIEELSTEIQGSSFGDFCRLDKRDIPVLLEGAAHNIAPKAADCSQYSRVCARGTDILIVDAIVIGRHVEGVEIDIIVEPIPHITGSVQVASRSAGKQSRTVEYVVVFRILQCPGARIEDQERCARLKDRSAVDLPAVREFAYAAVIDFKQSGKRQFVNI